MRDTIAAGTVAGLAGSLVLDGLTLLATSLGLKTSTPWDVAAYMFLNPKYSGTGYWLLIGLLGATSIGIIVGLLSSFIIRLTGSDYALLKGVLSAEAVGFAGISLIAPLLQVAQFLKVQPMSNLFAFISLAVFGMTTGVVLKRYAHLARH